MIEHISCDEFMRRMFRPRTRGETIEVEQPHILLEHDPVGPSGHCIASIEVHTYDADTQEFVIEPVREGERMLRIEAVAQADEVAEREGTPLVVVKCADASAI